MLIHGDCTKYLSDIEDESIDITITSPPYNIGIDYKGYEDKKEDEDYLNLISDVLSILYKKTVNDGSIFLNVAGSPSNKMLPHRIIAECLNKWQLQNEIVWIKSIVIDRYNIRGNFKPINSNRFLSNMHEYIFHLTKDKNNEINKKAIGVPLKDMKNIKNRINKNDGIRDRGTTWFIGYDSIPTKSGHPAKFPERLVEMCMLFHGLDKITTVCDPFTGSGTTGVVAGKFGKEFIGIELSEEYYNLARNNIAQATLTKKISEWG